MKSRPHPVVLLPGMIVRFPTDIEDSPTDFREFRLGRIEELDQGACSATIHTLIYDLSEPDATGDVKHPRLKLLGFLLHRLVPILTIGLTKSPQAFCVSASPAATCLPAEHL